MNKKQKNGVLLSSGMLLASMVVPYAMNVQEVEAKTNATNIINSANALKGTKYKWGGTTTKGFDCSGFVQYVFKKSGIQLPRTAAEMSKRGTSVAKGNLKAGDLVFFNTGAKKGKVTHVGIYIGNNKFIHSTTSKGVIVTDINDRYYWGAKFISAKRV